MPMNKRVKGPNYLLYFVPEIIGSLKHATFLRHGRQPEVNISQARTVVFTRFSNLWSLLLKRTEQYKCGGVKTT